VKPAGISKIIHNTSIILMGLSDRRRVCVTLPSGRREWEGSWRY